MDIYLADYPSRGTVASRAWSAASPLVPCEKVVGIAIRRPDGLTTRHGRKLWLRQEMSGTATIIIRDQRRLERIFFPADTWRGDPAR